MPGFVGRFARTWIVGCIGVAALLLIAPPPEMLARVQQQTGLSPLGVRALGLLNPLLLMTAMSLAGATLAHRVGLVSAIAGTSPVRPQLRALASAGALGLIVALAIVVADEVIAPYLGADWNAFRSTAEQAAGAMSLLTGLLYGGLAEELIMRWGLMSLMLFALAKAAGAPLDGTPARATLAWPAIAVAALAFGAAHLPALAQGLELSPGLIARTIGLNALAGVVYGWLYWRRGLEAAMTSHAASHIGFGVLRAFG